MFLLHYFSHLLFFPSISYILFTSYAKRCCNSFGQNQWETTCWNLAARTTSMIWAAALQNQQNNLCAQWRLRSAWASTQSDQCLCCTHQVQLTIERTAKTDQTGQMPRLICVFAGRMSFCWFCCTVTHIEGYQTENHGCGWSIWHVLGAVVMFLYWRFIWKIHTWYWNFVT